MAKSSSESNREKEIRLILEHNIHMLSSDHSVPESHQRSFDAIKILGSTPYNEPSDQVGYQDLIRRAAKLMTATRNIARTNPLEMNWRVAIENLVFERFDLQVTW
jgi:hypothetical protein